MQREIRGNQITKNFKYLIIFLKFKDNGIDKSKFILVFTLSLINLKLKKWKWTFGDALMA